MLIPFRSGPSAQHRPSRAPEHFDRPGLPGVFTPGYTTPPLRGEKRQTADFTIGTPPMIRPPSSWFSKRCPRRRRPRPSVWWLAEQLEDRRLLSSTAAARVLRGGLSGRWDGEPNDTRRTAVLVAPGVPTSDTIAPGDVDFFRLTPTRAGRLQAHVQAEAVGTRLSLFNRRGRLLAQGDGSGSDGREGQIDRLVPAGTYFLKVESQGGAGPYTVTTEVTTTSPRSRRTGGTPGTNARDLLSRHEERGARRPRSQPPVSTPQPTAGNELTPIPAAPDATRVDSPALQDVVPARVDLSAAVEITPGVPTSGTIAPNEIDLFRFTTDGGGRLIARVHAEGTGTRLSLLDEQGRLIVQSDGISPGNRENQVEQHVTSGTYYIQVESLGGAGIYSLTTELTAGSAPFQRSAVGEGPLAFAYVDLNGDGIIDLATANAGQYNVFTRTFSGSGDVSVLLGNGDGTFQEQRRFAVGNGPVSLLMADLNGDGRPDFATANAGSDDVSVLLGRGDGTFQEQQRFAAGDGSGSLVVTDLDGDSHPDLVTANTSSDDVSVLLGNGDGTFQEQRRFAVGAAPGSLVVTDLNGDGRPDLTAANAHSSDVSVLLGNGDGTFQEQRRFAVGAAPGSLVVTDLNGDGRLDLATVEIYFPVVSVLLGNGDGTFQDQRRFAVGAVSDVVVVLAVSDIAAVGGSLVVSDLNGDGHLDLATANGDVSVLLGNGDGTFQKPRHFTVGAFPGSLMVTDLNGDGRPDLATANGFFGDVSVLLGNSDGTFQEQRRLSVGYGPDSLVVTDLNGDGRPDLVAANTSSDDVSVLLGNGDGTFQEQRRFAVGYGPDSLVVTDLNGDGRPDLAAANVGSDDVSVLLNNGDGMFQEQRRFAVGRFPGSLVVTDLNGDSRPDLVAANTSSDDVSVLLGNGDGTFQEQRRFRVEDLSSSLVVTDLNGDGHPDLAAANGVSSDVSVLLGIGDGTFQEQRRFAVGAAPGSLVVTDLNGDGHPDLAVANGVSSDVSVLLGIGDGTFQEQRLLAVGAAPGSLVVTDLNGDGRPDLAATNNQSSDVSVRLNLEEGTFANAGPFATNSHATPLLADLDHDGADDVLVINQAGEILWRKGRSQEPGAFEPPINVNPDFLSRDIAIVESRQGPLIASVDARANSVTLFARRGGQFVRVGSLSTGLLPAQIETSDLNGDGLGDLVVRNAGDGSASVFLGDGAGNFRPWLGALPIGLGASDIRLADVDGSGSIDLIVTNQTTGDVRILFNRGDATFTRESRYHAGIGPYGLEDTNGMPTLYSLEETAGVAVGTFTRGGTPGLVTLNPGSNTLGVLDGLGGGAFANPRRILTDRPAQVIRSADVNGDGVSDVVLLRSDDLSIYLGDGRGGFMPPSTIHAGPNDTGLSVVDANDDGRLDLLVGNDFGDVLVLLGNGDGTFRPYQKTDRGVALAVADLDHDGHVDQVFANPTLDHVSVEYGTGTAGPDVVIDHSRGLLNPGAVALADLNLDGTPDLIVANSGSNNVLIYLGLGNGQFGPAANGGDGFFAGTNPVGITVADIDGDKEHIPDLAVSNRGSNDVSILLGRGRGAGWTLVPGPRVRAGNGPVSTVVQDVDGNGVADLLVSNSQSNNVGLVPGVGLGFFNDQNVTAIPVGTNPGPLFVGDFDPRPGLELITINQGSNDLTLVSGFAGRDRISSSLSSGGVSPVTGLGFDTNSDGVFDGLAVANNDGHLAFFLGGSGGLSLDQIFSTPALPHPTALAMSSFGNGKLSFYAASEGQETALLLSVTFGGGGSQQVARLVPLREQALALVASLVTGILNMPTTEADAVALPNSAAALATFSATASTIPNQGVTPTKDEDGVADEADDTEGAPADKKKVTPPEALPAWIRFIAGLDEAFDRQRRESLDDLPGGAGSPSLAARVLATLDAVLDRLTQDSNAEEPGLAERLRQVARPAARAIDAAIERLWSEDGPTASPSSAPDIDPARAAESQEDGLEIREEAEPEDVSAATVPLMLVAALLARRAWPQRWSRRQETRAGTSPRLDADEDDRRHADPSGTSFPRARRRG
jgi:hypothetical protein